MLSYFFLLFWSYFFKSTLSKKKHFKNTFSKLLPQEIHLRSGFQNCSSKIAPSKNTFPKLLPQYYNFKNAFLIFFLLFWSYFFKSTLSKNILKIHFQNCSLKIAPSKNAFSKLLSKLLFQNCSLNEYIFEIALWKIISLIALVYSSSESEEKSLKFSLICLITFFSMYLHSFKNTADNNSHLFWEQNLNWLLLNKYN